MDLIRVIGWNKFQHYKNRNPPWIKLHRELLTSTTWVECDDATRVLAIAIMLLAAATDNKIPADPKYLKRVAYLNKLPSLQPLIDLHFIEYIERASNTLADASNLHANAITEKETEQRQSERREEPLSASADFEAFWISSTRRGSKKDALSIWKQIPAPDRPAVLLGMAAWQKSEQWRDETKQPHIFRWLKRRGWEEIVPNSKRNGSVGSDEQARKQFEEIYGRPPVS